MNMAFRIIGAFIGLIALTPTIAAAQTLRESTARPGAVTQLRRTMTHRDTESGFVFTPSLQTQHDFAWVTRERAGKENADYRMRRQRIGANGRIANDIGYRLSVELSTASDDPELRDAYLSYRGLPMTYVAAGFTREANGMYEKASNVWLPFMERPQGITAFQSLRNYGVMISPHADHWTLQLGGYGTGTGNTGDHDGGWGMSARAVWRPWIDLPKHRVVHVGVNGRYRNPGADTLRYRSFGQENVLQDTLADTGQISGIRDVRNVSGEFYFTDGPLAILSEARLSEVVRGQGLSDPVFWGGTAQVTYFLTGEQRDYQLIGSTFGRMAPSNPVTEGGWGAWEAGVRLDAIDLTDADIDGGKVYSASFGLSWWPVGWARVMSQYVINEVEGSPATAQDPRYFLTRLQLAF